MLSGKERENVLTVSDLQSSLEACKKELEDANKNIADLKEESEQVLNSITELQGILISFGKDQ